MSVLAKVLVPSKLVENAQTTQYTAVNCKATIDKCTVTNVAAVNTTFSANLVTGGDAAGAQNQIVKSRTLAPNETYTCPELVGHTLESGGFISALAGAAAALTLRISGREIT